MGKSENIIKFEEMLKNDSNKRKAFEEELMKVESSVKNSSEAIAKAAKAIGFDLSQDEIERNMAEKQEMPDDELDKVSGGGCWISDSCHVAILHHKDVDPDDDCWEDYNCIRDHYSRCCTESYEHWDCSSSYQYCTENFTVY